MEKIKVLFVDDDIALGNVVAMALNAFGYEVHYQTSLFAIKSVIQEFEPDLIILDVEIGTQNGIDAAMEIGRLMPGLPILFVSSHIDSSEVARALHAGGIAYLKKPFEMEELLAYVQRHAAICQQKEIKVGIYCLNIDENILMKEGQIIKKLSLFECKLFKLFALNINQPVSREQIEQELWGEEESANEQSLNNYIAKLRKDLSEDKSLELVTLPKHGYKLTVL